MSQSEICKSDTECVNILEELRESHNNEQECENKSNKRRLDNNELDEQETECHKQAKCAETVDMESVIHSVEPLQNTPCETMLSIGKNEEKSPTGKGTEKLLQNVDKSDCRS